MAGGYYVAGNGHGRREEQSDQGVGSAAKFSQGKAGGRKDARDRQGVCVQSLFILHPLSGVRAPAEKAPSALESTSLL